MLLAIALIRHHYKSKVDDANASIPSLFYEHAEGKHRLLSSPKPWGQNPCWRKCKYSISFLQAYRWTRFSIPRIAHNYEDKILLIFGKWEFLKVQWGEIMLYDGFDFLIFKSHRSDLLMSIWLGGNKEFYDYIYALTHNATEILMPVYIWGRDCLKAYE